MARFLKYWEVSGNRMWKSACLWEIPTGKLVYACEVIQAAIHEWERDTKVVAEYRRLGFVPTGTSYRKNLANRRWHMRFQRERFRRQDSAYRGFINKIIHDPDSAATHYLVFADWLQDNNRELEARRVRQYCKHKGYR